MELENNNKRPGRGRVKAFPKAAAVKPIQAPQTRTGRRGPAERLVTGQEHGEARQRRNECKDSAPTAA